MLDHTALDTLVREQQAEAGRHARLQRLRRACRPTLRTRVARGLVGAASRLDPADAAARPAESPHTSAGPAARRPVSSRGYRAPSS